jgi:hypothetical protein
VASYVYELIGNSQDADGTAERSAMAIRLALPEILIALKNRDNSFKNV